VNITATETIFFYFIDKTLRQMIEVEIYSETDYTKQILINISTPKHGKCTTKILGLKKGKNDIKCYAPVVFPNMIDGKHVPIKAELEVCDDQVILKDEFVLGKHRPWTIYVCQDVCTDFTWGMNAEDTINESVELTKAHLAYMDITDSEKEESQNRWNINQTMEIEWFLERAGDDQIKKLLKREKEKRLEISAIYNSNLSALMSTEQGIRSLYFARELEKKYGLSFSSIEHIEMPTITWGMMSLFAGAGIKYFIKGWLDFNNHHLRKSNDIPLFYWQGPDGNSVLSYMDKGANLRAYYGHAHFLLHKSFGGPVNEYEDAINELHNWWIPNYENNDSFPYDAFMLVGSHVDLLKINKSEINLLVDKIIKYNKEPWEYPKIINATWSQYFENIEAFAKLHNIEIPIIKGDMGSSWEDWPAHYAHVATEMKKETELYTTAEKIAALENIFSDTVDELTLDKLHSSVNFMNHLAEHPWNGLTDVERFDQLSRKINWVKGLKNNNRDIIKILGNNKLEEQPTDIKSLNTFNPMSWQRSEEVVIGIKGFDIQDILAKYNKYNSKIQIVSEFGENKLVFLAEDVPPFGYKEVKLTTETNSSGTLNIDTTILENKFYKIKISEQNGSIFSIWDKKNNRELVNQSENLGINQYLYQSEGIIYKLSDIKISPVNIGPIRHSLLIEGTTLNSKVTTILTLYENLDKIEITNKVIKKPTTELQNIFFAFPFDIPNREYHYDCMASIIKPGLIEYGGDNIRGSGQEIYSVRNFINASNKNFGVTLSSTDSYLFQLGNMTYDLMPDLPDVTNSTMYSLVMTNRNYSEFFKDQGGNEEFTFRYAIKTHTQSFNSIQSARFGWNQNNPIIGIVGNANKKIFNKESQNSFITCDKDNVIITALKNAEDDTSSYILRLWEISGESLNLKVDVSSLGFNNAVACDLLERNKDINYKVENGIISVPIGAFGITTIKLSK